MCMACACARHVHGMGKAWAWHVYGMCTACVRHVYGMCTGQAPRSVLQVPTIQIFDGSGIDRVANLDCQPAQFKQARARHVARHTRGTARGSQHAGHGTRLTARVARMARASVYLSARLSSRWSRRLWRRSKRGYSGGAISMPRVRAPRWREVSTSPSVAAARVSACSTCSSRGSRACPRLARPPCGERRVAWAQARRVLQSPRRNEPRGRAHSDSIMHADVP